MNVLVRMEGTPTSFLPSLFDFNERVYFIPVRSHDRLRLYVSHVSFFLLALLSSIMSSPSELGITVLTPLHYVALFAHILALLLSFHLALRHTTCLCSSWKSFRMRDPSKRLFMWTLSSSFIGHLLLFPYYLVTYLHSHPISYKVIAHFFFFLSFILLNLSGIDRFQRFYLILPHSTGWHVLNLLRVLSVFFGLTSMVGVALAYKLAWFKYLIAFHSAWTGSLDCILNMMMISSTLQQSNMTSQAGTSPSYTQSRGSQPTGSFPDISMDINIDSSSLSHPVKSKPDSVVATAGSVPSDASLPRFLDKIQRRCQQDQSKRAQLKFKLIFLFTLLLLTDLIILAVYILAFNVLRHVRQELYELTTAIGSLHFWFCISLLHMFRQGLLDFSTTRKEHISTTRI